MRFHGLALRLAAASLLGTLAGAGGFAQTPNPHTLPVKAVGPHAFIVSAPSGSGVLRYFGTASLDGDPGATRAIIVVHGLLRDADEYEQAGEGALRAAGNSGAHTIVLTPQFLADFDLAPHALPADTLGWNWRTWLDGEPALTPAPISAFDVFDAMVARLRDRTRFPELREIVLAGHSAGGQLVQRYAVVGRPPAGAASLRYVVANPSSYLYFSTDRPLADGSSAPYDGRSCPGFNRWKYGLVDPPPYVRTTAGVETAYVRRRVTYLLGLLDVDPNHPVLDKSCSGELEGSSRLLRGRNYVRYLRGRHPEGTNQDEVDVPGVDHDGAAMFSSPCGVAVLFGGSPAKCEVRKV
jgi:pimeloyl-ACP methyl ester carboxylesterase